MIRITIHAGTRWMSTSETRAAEINNLSAMGSSSVPTVVICPQRRARYPSRRSVAASASKISSANVSRVIPSGPSRAAR
jgi:hypothetical protein